MAGKQLEGRMRRDQAMNKAKKVQARLRLVEYKVDADDVQILSGPYNGRTVKDLWVAGPNERDYIVKHLAMRNDEAVMRIIRSLCGN